MQKLGITPQDFCTLSFCTLDPNFRFSELTASAANTLFFIPEHTEYDIFVPAGVQTAYVSFSQQAFLAGARVLNPADWDRAPQQLLMLQSSQQVALKAVMDLWHKIAETTTLADKVLYKSAVNGILLQQILQVATAIKTEDALPSLAERLRALHICRKARIFVEDSLAVDIVPTIVDICASVGASERTLQYAFRSYVNLSPLAYLRFCRLNRVRARLLAADPKITTVTSVAMSFGFLHLGRFSSDYKKAFDELPSETLAT